MFQRALMDKFNLKQVKYRFKQTSLIPYLQTTIFSFSLIIPYSNDNNGFLLYILDKALTSLSEVFKTCGDVQKNYKNKCLIMFSYVIQTSAISLFPQSTRCSKKLSRKQIKKMQSMKYDSILHLFILCQIAECNQTKSLNLNK